MCFYLLLVVGLVMLSPVVGWAQFENASVLGYVHDGTGAAVAGSAVTLTNQATGVVQTTKTDSDGRYEFVSVPVGSYQIAAEATGFDRTQTDGFRVTVNARQRIDVSLKTGSTSETVNVSAAATLLETETSSRGQVIAEHEIENLPLNGRSYADLALLVPGVRKSLLENQSTSGREASYNVNGQRSAFNNFLLDGLDNNSYGTSNQGFANENIPPSPDAVGEFRVETNNYSAEYGRASGAVINASVRRGTNSFHGRAWEYNRNTNLNAIGPFRPAGNVKPVLIRNQFGGTFGGPILKDKFFFFGDYEGMRQVSKIYTTATVPTMEQRAGQIGVGLVNPLNGTKYTNGVIPTSAFSPLASKVFAALPTVAAASVGSLPSNNMATLPRGFIQDDKGDIRLDYIPTAKTVLFARYSEHRGSIFDPPAITGRAGGNSNGNVHLFNRQVAAGVTYTVTAKQILDARVGIGWNEGGKSPIGVGESSLLAEAGITNGVPTDPQVVRPLNGQVITGFTQLGAQTSNPQFQNPFVVNPKVNYTWLRGLHSLKFGYEFQSIATDINDFNPSYGQDTYNGKFSAAGATDTTGKTVTSSNLHNLADFIFGARNNYQLNNFRIVGLRQKMNFMYVQDDVKVTSKLTVNAGLRYELVTPQYEKDNHLANFDPSSNSLIQASSGSIYNRGLVNTPKTNLGPRLGLSYSADEKTVIRGGFGISYTQFNRAGGENLLVYNGPYIVNASIDQTPIGGTSAAPTYGANLCQNDTQDQTKCFRPTQMGYSTSLVLPAAFDPIKVQSRYIPKNNKTGYVESYHAGIQRQFGKDMLIDLSYVGNHGVHIMLLADYNQARQVTAAEAAGTVPSLQARRPVSNFNTIEVAYGGGTTNYNALQLKFEKRYGSGLYLLNSFTWSRGFDLASGHLETSSNDTSRVNYANSRGDYGPSSYDQPLNNTTSVVYDLPFFKKGGWTKSALGGWQATAINTMTSGLPMNVIYSVNSSYTVSGLVNYRPNKVAGVNPVLSNKTKVSGGAFNYLTSTAFSNPASASNPNPFGNSTRNGVRGPSFYQLDLGMHKAFALWREGSSFDFRAEAFNLFNHANYQTPDTNWSNSTFGQITAAYPARQLQLAAKLIF
ncbi:TonB-dependent receptor [Terriglobus albidus]|uniref:TonB-dependent receptor n=2 Tax=Terriglobus albidus TaxID=1592106 RepID=A0A5B9EGN9_9BACT|nr:TonB-dependent receptor [Terriglobus albidus]